MPSDKTIGGGVGSFDTFFPGTDAGKQRSPCRAHRPHTQRVQ
jgi:hypothetical protein